MSNENCIDVKYVSNLSVAYLTRFFGSAGQVLKVEKNENSKYVTIVRSASFRSLPIGRQWRRLYGSREGFWTKIP